MKNWANYLFHRNFTEQAEILAAVPLGVLSEDNAVLLAASLQEVDTGEGKEFWNFAPGSEWTLHGAEVIHNGANSQSFATKSTFKNVLVLKFPETSAKPQDRLYLQYN